METDVLIPLLCIGLFLLLILIFFGWFFYTMNRRDEAGREKRGKLYRSGFLKKAARYHASRGILPNTYGGKTWRSWLRK